MSNLSARKDIRLGDLVVSVPKAEYGGVVQYDFCKPEASGVFSHCGQLNAPPSKLSSNSSILQNFMSRLRNPKIHVRGPLLMGITGIPGHQ